jgi:8-oxo-dGTP pyrophosphatase MutT (NUDIX family)
VAGLTDDEARFAHLAEGTYKEHWDLPGGMAETNEPPRAAAMREVREELGLPVRPGRVLLLDWIGPHGPWDDQLLFIFDGGVFPHDQIRQLTPRDPEISDVAAVPVEEARQLLRADMADRLSRALHALAGNATDYHESTQE